MYKAPEGTVCVNTAGYRMMQIYITVFMSVFGIAVMAAGVSDSGLEGWRMGVYMAGVLFAIAALIYLGVTLKNGIWYRQLLALIFGILGVMMVGAGSLS